MPYKDKDRKRAADILYQKTHPELRKQISNRYYEKHRLEILEKQREYKKAHPERRAAALLKYRLKNLDRERQRLRIAARKYYWKNRDKQIEMAREWKKANIDRCNFLRAKRRAAELNATPKWLSADQLEQIARYYTQARDLYKKDGIVRAVDHIYPLQGKTCCGLNVPWNLQILTKSENSAKYNRIPMSKASIVAV
jgi:hypothetical protein